MGEPERPGQPGLHEDFEKFWALPEEKRERILNAAMKEFLGGYKKASTDNIVREAGISKGILFHYFGTKERLYNFLIEYAIGVLQREYIDLIDIIQPDILESIWQLSLLKQELSIQFPAIFDFMTAAFVDETAKSEGTLLDLSKFKHKQAEIMAQVYAQADMSLFREDINPKTAMEIIAWTLHGYGQSKMGIAPGESIGQTARENYNVFLTEFEEILGTLRKCFYK
ncbi:MAG: TetR/AcrR family transcriptional regulator [Defluviitaleaceae bacterium]|nr:TetR/AcrR family transcriptional regulator [Defluviitaleaceae bacterium]